MAVLVITLTGSTREDLDSAHGNTRNALRLCKAGAKTHLSRTRWSQSAHLGSCLTENDTHLWMFFSVPTTDEEPLVETAQALAKTLGQAIVETCRGLEVLQVENFRSVEVLHTQVWNDSEGGFIMEVAQDFYPPVAALMFRS